MNKEKFSLSNRNTTGELIAFLRKGNKSIYCIAPVEYWIVEYWNGYVDLTRGELGDLYFEYLKQFQVDFIDLKSEFKKLQLVKDEFEIEGNKPKIYVDFDKKYFRSYFHEQELERRIPNDWKGEYGEIINMINQENNYWKE